MDFSPRVQELKVEAAKCCCPTVPSATADDDAKGGARPKKTSVIYDKQHGFDRRSLVHLSTSGFFSRSLVCNHLLSNFISHQIYKQTLCVSPQENPFQPHPSVTDVFWSTHFLKQLPSSLRSDGLRRFARHQVHTTRKFCCRFVMSCKN